MPPRGKTRASLPTPATIRSRKPATPARVARRRRRRAMLATGRRSRAATSRAALLPTRTTGPPSKTRNPPPAVMRRRILHPTIPPTRRNPKTPAASPPLQPPQNQPLPSPATEPKQAARSESRGTDTVGRKAAAGWTCGTSLGINTILSRTVTTRFTRSRSRDLRSLGRKKKRAALLATEGAALPGTKERAPLLSLMGR